MDGWVNWMGEWVYILTQSNRVCFYCFGLGMGGWGMGGWQHQSPPKKKTGSST